MTAPLLLTSQRPVDRLPRPVLAPPPPGTPDPRLARALAHDWIAPATLPTVLHTPTRSRR